MNPFKKKSKQIDKEYWKKIWWNKSEAKKALVNLEIKADNGKMAKVLHVDLANGNRIPVEDITEDQAHEFMKALCPDWVFKD